MLIVMKNENKEFKLSDLLLELEKFNMLVEN